MSVDATEAIIASINPKTLAITRMSSRYANPMEVELTGNTAYPKNVTKTTPASDATSLNANRNSADVLKTKE